MKRANLTAHIWDLVMIFFIITIFVAFIFIFSWSGDPYKAEIKGKMDDVYLDLMLYNFLRAELEAGVSNAERIAIAVQNNDFSKLDFSSLQKVYDEDNQCTGIVILYGGNAVHTTQVGCDYDLAQNLLSETRAVVPALYGSNKKTLEVVFQVFSQSEMWA